MALSKEGMEEVLKALEESEVSHDQQRKLHETMGKGEKFLKGLVEKELEKFK